MAEQEHIWQMLEMYGNWIVSGGTGLPQIERQVSDSRFHYYPIHAGSAIFHQISLLFPFHPDIIIILRCDAFAVRGM